MDLIAFDALNVTWLMLFVVLFYFIFCRGWRIFQDEFRILGLWSDLFLFGALLPKLFLIILLPIEELFLYL